MAVEVAEVELKSVQDASGLEERLGAGQFTADEVVAVVGKTKGNGGVNDFTRLLADQAFRRVLLTHGTRTEAKWRRIPMVWSGGLRRRHHPPRHLVCAEWPDGSPDQVAPSSRGRHERGA